VRNPPLQNGGAAAVRPPGGSDLPTAALSRQRWGRPLLVGLSVAGYALLAGILWWGISTGLFWIPGGDVHIWDRAGDTLRAGGEVYAIQPLRNETIWYAPPFVVLFAAVSWLPIEVLWIAIVALEVGALRYIAGSWLGFGLACLFPLTAFELVSGNFNMLVAAAIVAAIQRRAAPATIMSFAKLSPILAVHPRDWRVVAVTAAVMVAITIPWIGLWPVWVAHLAAAYGQPLGPQIPIPFILRAAIAAGLLLLFRPWSRAMAAFVAIPAMYWGSLVLLLAPAAVVLRRLPRTAADGDERR
jgi:hypothetical protein